MKNIYLILTIILILLMLTLPLIALTPINENPPTEQPPVSESVELSPNDTITLYHSDGKTVTMGVNEYIFGVVAAEMPLSYGEEALKAQAVAARTFLLYRKSENRDKDYDITVSSDTDQAFITRTDAKEKWGDKAEEYIKKLDDIIKQTENILIYYEDKPILAAYHAISAGKTEAGENVWGKSIPYLKSVDSIGDLLSPKYQSTVSVPAADFKAALKGCTLPKEYKDYIGKITRTDSGYVKTIVIGDKTFSGADVRKLFNLRSSSFDIALKEDSFVFSVRGYGHGVGMSQYGAEYMAQQGNTYDEILLWYYKGCKIVKTDSQ